MQLGEILDGSFSIYRRHFGLFMRLSVILIWLPTALIVYLSVRFAGTPLEFLNVIEQNPLASIGVGLLALILWVSSSLLLKAGTIRIISDSYLGQEPDLATSLRFGLSKLLPLLLVSLSKGLLLVLLYLAGVIAVLLMVAVGKLLGAVISVLLIIAGLAGFAWFLCWVMSGYGTTTPIVVLEDMTR